ncbi:MAG TPA: hypothetical protein VNE21_08820 [Mycobacteriales bacterium]|nr:hypothetical protein [Mycobacteriales bacterium]
MLSAEQRRAWTTAETEYAASTYRAYLDKLREHPAVGEEVTLRLLEIDLEIRAQRRRLRELHPADGPPPPA